MTHVTTPWGRATTLAEVAVPQRAATADGEKVFEPIVQLLETESGDRLVRFAYRTDGVVRRGPVTVRVKDLARVRKAITKSPELHKALVGDV
jgi:hypothetical protein